MIGLFLAVPATAIIAIFLGDLREKVQEEDIFEKETEGKSQQRE